VIIVGKHLTTSDSTERKVMPQGFKKGTIEATICNLKT